MIARYRQRARLARRVAERGGDLIGGFAHAVLVLGVQVHRLIDRAAVIHIVVATIALVLVRQLLRQTANVFDMRALSLA